jgi:membrane protein DedA with SNARE-associated domain
MTPSRLRAVARSGVVMGEALALVSLTGIAGSLALTQDLNQVTFAVMLAGALFLGQLLGFWLVRRHARRVADVLEQNARAIRDHDASHREITTILSLVTQHLQDLARSRT